MVFQAGITMSHGSLPREERYARGITYGLLRLSVGLEDLRDLCDDLEAALQGKGNNISVV